MGKRNIQKGPSWVEVGLGAVLAVALGVILGALFLIAKPVEKVTAIPKDPPAGAVYYIEGSRDYGRSSAAEAMRKKFLDGESVDLTEGDVNLFLGDSGDKSPKPAGKPGDKPGDAAKMITPGALNARIHAGTIQFGLPVDFNILTVMGTIIIQTTGTFEKHSSEFVYVPDSVMIGGCPVNRIPFAKDIILSKLVFTRPIPDDIAAAWSKLSSVTIDGTMLHLRSP
jgi:hypothetical protein